MMDPHKVGTAETLHQLDSDGVVNLTGAIPAPVWDDQQQIEVHPAFWVLNSKKYWNLTTKRTHLLALLDYTASDLFFKEQLDIGSLTNRAFQFLKNSGITDGKRKQNWNQKFVTEFLVCLFLLFETTDAIQADHRSSSQNGGNKVTKTVSAVRNLQKLVKEAIAKGEVDASINNKTTGSGRTKKVNTATKRVQDEVPFNKNKVDSEPCPSCGHYCCMPVQTTEDVKAHNEAVKAEHAKKLAIYNALSAAEKTRKTKPCMGKTTSQAIACFCCRQICLCRTNGVGCTICEGFAKNAAGHTQVVWNQATN